MVESISAKIEISSPHSTKQPIISTTIKPTEECKIPKNIDKGDTVYRRRLEPGEKQVKILQKNHFSN